MHVCHIGASRNRNDYIEFLPFAPIEFAASVNHVIKAKPSKPLASFGMLTATTDRHRNGQICLDGCCRACVLFVSMTFFIRFIRIPLIP